MPVGVPMIHTSKFWWGCRNHPTFWDILPSASRFRRPGVPRRVVALWLILEVASFRRAPPVCRDTPGERTVALESMATNQHQSLHTLSVAHSSTIICCSPWFTDILRWTDSSKIWISQKSCNTSVRGKIPKFHVDVAILINIQVGLSIIILFGTSLKSRDSEPVSNFHPSCKRGFVQTSGMPESD